MVTSIIIICFLLVISAFFSASETGLMGASKARLHLLAQRGNRYASSTLRLLEKQSKIISIILFGNNLVNIFASSLAASLLIEAFGEENGIWINTVIMTFLILIFAEILPKTIAIHKSDSVALFVTPFIRFFYIIFIPFVFATDKLIWVILNLIGINKQHNVDTQTYREEELKGAIAMHEDDHEPETYQEKIMLQSILDLDETDISAVMTHRAYVQMIDIKTPLKDILSDIRERNFAHFPVYEDDNSNIIGVLNVKSLLYAHISHFDDIHDNTIDIKSHISEPWFIPDSTSLLDQLQAFRKKRETFAVVVDEYGALVGVVTLKDILKQIVGNIGDQYDNTADEVYKQANGSVIVDGTIAVLELNRQCDWNFPDDIADTIAGLVLYEARIIPEKGQIFELYGYRIEILKKYRHQILSMRITAIT